jgi:hypothetical protein
MVQETEAAHAGHSKIEHKAARLVGRSRFQKDLRGLECVDAEAHRREEVPEGPTQRGIVVEHSLLKGQ